MKTISNFFLLLFLSSKLFSQPCKEVVGYYPGWQWYDRNKLVNPMSIDYSKYTIINYAFFQPDTAGTISGTDSWADTNLLLGPAVWTPVFHHDTTQSLPYQAHQNNVKVLISVGGWTLSDNFPMISASAAKRAKFAANCITLINVFNLDGIDIDWEYPGFAPHSGTPQDKANFTLFMAQIRDSLNALALKTGKTFLLTGAFPASPANAANIQWSSLNNYIDMFNLMSYDFFGSWDAVSNHNSPLYPPTQGTPAFNVDSAFRMLTQVYSVPPGKINIGAPFYGRSFANCTALFGTHSGGNGDVVTFSADAGVPQYYNVMANYSLFNYFWDNQAQVPYLLGKSGLNTMVSYDDKKSIGMKASYAVNNNARGMIIWEITGDYMETSSGSGIIAGTPLADTINAVFCNANGIGLYSSYQNEVNIFPNPALEKINIEFISFGNSFVKIYDSQGRAVVQKNFIDTNSRVSCCFSFPAGGIYFAEIFNGNETVHKKIIRTE